VTEPRDQDAPESPQPRPGEQIFRDELLRDMSGGEMLSLSDIDSIIAYDYRAEPLSTRQSRVITAIKSLLNDGLIVSGDPGFAGEPVESWQLPTEKPWLACTSATSRTTTTSPSGDGAPGSSSPLKVSE